MKFSTAFVALVSAALALAQNDEGQRPTLNTPEGVTQCLSTELTWINGKPPYTLTIHPGSDINSAPLRDLGEQAGKSFSWRCDVPENTQIFARIRDDEGRISNTAPFNVLPGDDDCLSGATSGGGGSSTTGGTTGGDGTTTTTGGGSDTSATGGGGGTTTTGGSGNTRSSSAGGSSETSTSSQGGAGFKVETAKSVMVAGAAAVAMAVFA